MKLSGVALSIIMALNGATFVYAVSIEHRLTRLETLAESRGSFKDRGQFPGELRAPDLVRDVPLPDVLGEAQAADARRDDRAPR